MMKKSILFTLSGLLIFSGCTTSAVVQKETKSTAVVFNIIKTSEIPDDYLEYSEGKKEFLVYHSDLQSDIEAFKTEYEKLTGESAPNFKGNMIIAKSGTKTSTGYTISIDSVKDAGRFTEVTILSESPGKGCLAGMALTNPYIVAKFQDDHKDVKFVEKNVKKNCD